MGLAGGGYTFLSMKALPSLTNDEVQAMFTDRSGFLMRVLLPNTTQPYAVLEQLPRYVYVELMRMCMITILHPVDTGRKDRRIFYLPHTVRRQKNYESVRGVTLNRQLTQMVEREK